MLVEYFVKRYAAKARKPISKIDKHTLELCQSYHWPGNIRELQNIIERSVILCAGDTFSVERAWLSSQAVSRPEPGALTDTLQSYEKEIIEKALAEIPALREEFHKDVRILERYDDNRQDLAGDVARRVAGAVREEGPPAA